MTGAFMSTDAKSGKVQGVVIGIDLGTTNSCVAVMDGRTPKVGSGPAFKIARVGRRGGVVLSVARRLHHPPRIYTFHGGSPAGAPSGR
jgi:hypothetical protein